MSGSPTDLANWNWAQWTLAFLAAGVAWMFVIAIGLVIAGAAWRILAWIKKRP